VYVLTILLYKYVLHPPMHVILSISIEGVGNGIS
jgi:hypothetical protein